MREIGGYFEIELPKKSHYYPDLLQLNSGRSCLDYILRVKKYSKIYLPFYICGVVLEPIIRMGVNYEYYSIDENFKIKSSIDLLDDEVLLYVNYFGLMDDYIKELSNSYNNLIIDNAQAFYSRPITDDIITYYSPRKFFGVPDGGYLSINEKLNEKNIEQDISFKNAIFLFNRADMNAQSGYADFKKNEERIDRTELKLMSNLSQKILKSIDYNSIKKTRERNFKVIHKSLKKQNKIKIEKQKINGPMIYPFLIDKRGLREFLISKNVFVAKYWDNVNDTCSFGSFEWKLANNLVAIPIDQRYDTPNIKYVISLVEEYLKHNNYE
jgi:hypothetical protein